jgi:hypothetical protein
LFRVFAFPFLLSHCLSLLPYLFFLWLYIYFLLLFSLSRSFLLFLFL